MTAIDCYNDPYQERFYSKVKRAQFEALKKTQAFAAWRTRQYKVQDNKCAYCKVVLGKNEIITHIDHVTPLRFDGKNDYNNFVLSCKKCNMKKWISNTYVYPQWIKDNDNRMRQEQRVNSLRRRQKQQAIKINDDIILEGLDWI